MGLTVLSWSNALNQESGYATCQRHILPAINRTSEHEVLQLACSGHVQAPPIVLKGVKVYPRSEYGGDMGEKDVEYIVEMEDVDLLLTQFDIWTLPDAIQKLASAPEIPPIAVYAPIHTHGPEFMAAPAPWRPVFDAADVLIPYCEFGKRVMREEGVEAAKIEEPIYHGVDQETFAPQSDPSPADIDEETFVVGSFKALQGTRGAHERSLRAFRDFLEVEDAWDDARLYMHCSKDGSNAFHIPTLVQEFDLGQNVVLPTPAEYRWKTDDERMARLYSACDVVLNTARGEGFGLPILEAMACGTSVIAGAYSSMPELVLGEEGEIRYNEVATDVIDAPRGWLVPTWDTVLTRGKLNYRRRFNRDHIVEALQTAYNNPDAREEKGQNGREFALDHTWEDKTEQFVALFDRLEDELWEPDETTGVAWKRIGGEGAEHGGVGGLGGVGDPT